MKIYKKNEIEQAIHIPYLIQEIEKGLILTSEDKALIPSVGSLNFLNADVHIKSGAFLHGDMYIVKIASGFYENPRLGLPSSNGVMLLFSQKTGELIAILLDEGRLTDIRTGLAGAIVAKYLAPSPVTKIGIIGTGIQAREQLFHLQYVIPCREVMVWGRDEAKAQQFGLDPYLEKFSISVAKRIEDLTAQCNLIVTTTPSSKPLLFAHQIKPGTHITAIGADNEGKQEIDASIFECANLIVVDNLAQCLSFGDVSHAKNINPQDLVELGKLIRKPIQRNPNWITVADLTGIAIADLQVAKAVYKNLTEKKQVFFS